MTIHPLRKSIKLNLGCGTDLRPGFVNVDKFATHPDVVLAELPLIPFETGTVQEVVLSNVLEHFGFKEGATLCGEIYRVLEVGGIARIEVPDIQWCAAQFLGAPEPASYTDPTFDYNTHHKWGLFAQSLWGDQHNDGLYHKWGYTAHRLLNLLQHVGFSEVQVDFVQSHGVQCLSAVAIKTA